MKLFMSVPRILTTLSASSALALVFFLSGCVLPPEAYGPPPTNYRARIMARMTTELRHPESATYTFEKPETTWQADIIPHGNPIDAGWQVLFWVRDGGDRSDSEWYADFFHGRITEIGPYKDPLQQ